MVIILLIVLDNKIVGYYLPPPCKSAETLCLCPVSPAMQVS